MSTTNTKLVRQAESPSPEPVRAALTYPHVFMLALALGFTAWLMAAQGHSWQQAALITFAITAGMLVITKAPWHGAARAVRAARRFRVVRDDPTRDEAVPR